MLLLPKPDWDSLPYKIDWHSWRSPATERSGLEGGIGLTGF